MTFSLYFGLLLGFLILYGTSSVDYCDTPRPWDLYFQNNTTSQMESFLALPELDYSIIPYTKILVFVSWAYIIICPAFLLLRYFLLSPITGKFTWEISGILYSILTITMSLISFDYMIFKLICMTDNPVIYELTKGHQWYWSYQYPDFLNSDRGFVEFDPYFAMDRGGTNIANDEGNNAGGNANNNNANNDNNGNNNTIFDPEGYANTQDLLRALEKCENNTRVKSLKSCGFSRQEAASVRNRLLNDPQCEVRGTLEYYSPKNAWNISNSTGFQKSIMRELHRDGAWPYGIPS